MKYSKLSWVAALLLISGYAQANYMTVISLENQTVSYKLGSVSIPDAVGATTAWQQYDSLAYYTSCHGGGDGSATFSLTIGGTQVDDATWKTDNAGVGIQYKLLDGYTLFPPTERYPYETEITSSCSGVGSYVHVEYRLVRLAQQLPPGDIGPLPTVTVNVKNDEPAVSDQSQLFLSGMGSSPTVTNCTIDAPSQITLPDLQTADVVEHTNLGTTPIPITLKNCPGAVNNITYKFSPADGTQDRMNGSMFTASGSAHGVYLRLTKDNGNPYPLNEVSQIDNYQGSGDYALPANISYYIVTESDVTVGPVNEALTLTVGYN
jgi:type 1 fimbria pilin